jgi:hypothetical protein
MADLDEAWENAERGFMRLQMADVLLRRAQLRHDSSELGKAGEIIAVCGYWRRKQMLKDTEEEAKTW